MEESKIIPKSIQEYEELGKINLSNKLNALEPLQDKAANVYTRIYEQDETLPDKVVTAIQDEILNVQDEHKKTIEKGGEDAQDGSRALSRITAWFKRITNEAVNLRKNIGLVTQDSNNWNVSEIHKDNINPLMSVLDFDNIDENDGVEVKFVNNKLTFTTQDYNTGTIEGEEFRYGDPISFNGDDLKKMLPHKTQEFANYGLENLTTYGELGETDGVDNNYNWNENTENDVFNGYKGQIKTKEDFQSAKTEITEAGIPGFKDVLIRRVDVGLFALNNVFVDIGGKRLQGQELFNFLNTDTTLNDDGMQTLNESDLIAGLEGENKKAFQKVFDQLLDALTNVHNPAFNLDVSAGLLADHHTSYTKQKYDAGFKGKGGEIPGQKTAADYKALLNS